MCVAYPLLFLLYTFSSLEDVSVWVEPSVLLFFQCPSALSLSTSVLCVWSLHFFLPSCPFASSPSTLQPECELQLGPSSFHTFTTRVPCQNTVWLPHKLMAALLSTSDGSRVHALEASLTPSPLAFLHDDVLCQHGTHELTRTNPLARPFLSIDINLYVWHTSCTAVVCDSCREEYCCGPICERCNSDREQLMKCDKCEAPVCEKCLVITKANREGNSCKSCKDRVGVASETTVGA